MASQKQLSRKHCKTMPLREREREREREEIRERFFLRE
jgi:hypothetical protein